MSSSTVDNPFFARLWTVMSGHEPESLQATAPREPGRAVGPGARGRRGHRHQFRVLSRHRDRGRRGRTGTPARRAGAGRGGRASVPVTVSTDTVEQFLAAIDRSTRWCARWCCARSINPMMCCGNCFRCCGRVESCATSNTSPAVAPRAGLQRFVDATVWPRLLGNCHTHRHTERTIRDAGFEVAGARRERTMPAWVPVPVTEFAIGRAIRPA